MLLNISAPIVPFEGLGEKLYSTRDELRELLEKEGVESKLFRITTLDNYQGKLFGK